MRIITELIVRMALENPRWGYTRTAQFRRLIAEARTALIRLPPRSPNLNAYAERFVRSIKEECLDRMIFVGQGALRRAVTELVLHYHQERNHQGLGNRLLQTQQSR